jgi:hypothetical protein
MLVRYRPVPDRVAVWSVWLMGEPTVWLAGFVTQTGDHWLARKRGQAQANAARGFLRRRDAAAFLLVASGFCRAPKTTNRAGAAPR